VYVASMCVYVACMCVYACAQKVRTLLIGVLSKC